jgi:hypothetical protein
LLDDWHLQHWLPMPGLPCKKYINSPHLKSTQHLTCLTLRHHLLPMPHTNCHSACPSREPESVIGYFCLSRARKSGMAKNRDGKPFQRIISNVCDLSATVDYSLLTWSYFCSEDSLKIGQKVCTFRFLLKYGELLLK